MISRHAASPYYKENNYGVSEMNMFDKYCPEIPVCIYVTTGTQETETNILRYMNCFFILKKSDD